MYRVLNKIYHGSILLSASKWYCDVDGSVEAIIDILATYQSRLCKLDIIHFDVGNVTLNDIELAELFNAVIYAFNVSILPEAKDVVLQKSVDVRHHNVIYKLIDDLKSDINRQLPAVEEHEILGEATVLQQFVVTEGRKKVPVAGCRCTKGTLKRNALYKLVRNKETIHEGTLQSMRHLKDEVDTIKQDLECGLRLADTSIAFQPGDTLICYVTRKRDQVTDWNPGF